jgi:hypothetical protein
MTIADGSAAAAHLTVICRKALWAVLTVLIVMGCMHDQSTPDHAATPAARIIIKFADGRRHAPKTLEVKLSNKTAMELRHVRALSGEAQLYEASTGPAQLSAIVQALNQRSDVEYAEPDQKRHLLMEQKEFNDTHDAKDR